MWKTSIIPRGQESKNMTRRNKWRQKDRCNKNTCPLYHPLSDEAIGFLSPRSILSKRTNWRPMSSEAYIFGSKVFLCNDRNIQSTNNICKNLQDWKQSQSVIAVFSEAVWILQNQINKLFNKSQVRSTTLMVSVKPLIRWLALKDFLYFSSWISILFFSSRVLRLQNLLLSLGSSLNGF